MTTIPADHARAIAAVTAIQHGDIATLQSLLLADPSLATVRIVDKGVGRTLLHVVTDWPAHWPNATQSATLLIEAGADVNARLTPSNHGETPLHWAASADDVAMIDVLVNAGADLEIAGAVITGGTPIANAVVFAQWNAARRLLAHGAQTTLWQAAALGLLDRVRALVDADTSMRDVTNAFWNACRGGQRETAQFLLDRGADSHWIGHDHKTPLQVARESGNEELIAWLQTCR